MTLGTHHWMNLKSSGCDHRSCAWESFEQVMVMVMIGSLGRVLVTSQASAFRSF